MTPLEALEKLINYKCSCMSEKVECKEIIETALKEHELMKQTKIIVANKKINDDDLEKLKNQRMFVDSIEHCEIKLLFDEETQKKLKALEIIKKHISIYEERFAPYDRPRLWHVYLKMEGYLDEKHEEYDFLKEVIK